MFRLNWITPAFLYLFALLAVSLSFQIGFTSSNVVAVWPVAAINYWAIRRYAHTAMLPLILADFTHGLVILDLPPTLLMISITSVLAAYIAVSIEKYLIANTKAKYKDNGIFTSIYHLSYILMAGFIALSLLTASAGIILINLNSPTENSFTLWWRWVLADYTGLIMFTPALIYADKVSKQLICERSVAMSASIIIAALLLQWHLTHTGFSRMLANTYLYYLSLLWWRYWYFKKFSQSKY